MIEITAAVEEAFLDELNKIGGFWSGAKNVAEQAGKGVSQLAKGEKGLWEGAKKTWGESAKQVGKEGKPLGFFGRVGHTIQNDPGAALMAAGGAGVLGTGAVYEAGKSRGRHGY